MDQPREGDKNKSEIQDIGSYFDVSPEGTIINPASQEKIPENWKAPVEKTVEIYKSHYGDKLVSVYIRGSVTRGKAIDGVSDIDSIAIVDLDSNELEDISWSNPLQKEILAAYPFVQRVEIDPVSLTDFKERNDIPIVLATQSVCIYGKDIAEDLPPLHPGKEIFLHLPAMEQIVAKWTKRIEESSDSEATKRIVSSVMKRRVRSGSELTAERSQKYTRDLYPSWKVFAEYYSEKAAEMRQALEFSINPTDNKEVAIMALRNLGKWLYGEYKKQHSK